MSASGGSWLVRRMAVTEAPQCRIHGTLHDRIGERRLHDFFELLAGHAANYSLEMQSHNGAAATSS